MSSDLIKEIKSFVEKQIVSFETGLHQKLTDEQPKRLKLLSGKYQPFITIFRDLHEIYYTNTCNSIINSNDKFVAETFTKFQKLSNHSDRCILTILANLTVSVHFNIDRKQLDYSDRIRYTHCLKREISKLINLVDIPKLFDHNCSTSKPLTLLSNGQKFINIDISHKPIENQ